MINQLFPTMMQQIKFMKHVEVAKLKCSSANGIAVPTATSTRFVISYNTTNFLYQFLCSDIKVLFNSSHQAKRLMKYTCLND